MTRSKNRTVKNESASKANNGTPYSLPSDAQLLAYWHYQNSVPRRELDFGVVPPKSLEEPQRRDENDDLIKELRGSKSERLAFSASRYVHDIRLLSKWRLVAGQKRDGCIQLDQQLDIERQKYLEIKREYKECVTALESFLAQDHEASMRALNEAEEESKLTFELSERRDDLSRRYGQSRLQVYHWEEAWRTVKACQNFLQRVSPLGNDQDAEEDSAIRTGGSEMGHANSLESIIAAFEREATSLSAALARTPADLGLVEPADLLRLFRDVELQNLNALVHLESLGGPMADMIARIDVAEVRVKHEIEDVLEGIRQLEGAIEREERRAKRLERQSGQLLQRRFRALVCSAEALQARILVEEAYESCVAPNEAGLDALAMARGLEAAYEKLSAELDSLPRHLVLACEKEGFQQETKENREAEEAARKFELMQRLLAALRRIMEPTEPRRRTLMRRSVPKTRRKRRKTKKDQIIDKSSSTARETLHLDFFGKLCKPKQPNDDSDEDEVDK